MPSVFASLGPDRVPELRQFLAKIFGAADSLSLRQDFIDWKYFAPHPWWPGSRSYILDTDLGIAAHGCVVPVRYRTGIDTIESMQVIDWAASGLVPGAGILLFRYCLEIAGGTLLVIGGSDDTRRLIPRLEWFTRKDDLRIYARPLRFWRYWNPSSGVARNLGRISRNFHWQIAPSLPAVGGWRCRTLTLPDRIFMPEDGCIPILRTPEWFEYLMRCPELCTEFLVLEKNGIPFGHALLANAAGSVRIADFVVTGDGQTGALSAVIRHAANNPGAAEIVAGSSLPALWPHFEACGLRLRENLPVYAADPNGLIPGGAVLEVAPMMGDTYSLYDPLYPFRC